MQIMLLHKGLLRVVTWMMLACLLPASGLASQPVLENVTLQLKWRHQFQFAGYYAAQEKGFFHEEGLNVSLLPGGPAIAPLTEVMEGRAQYAIDAGELVYYRLQGKPVVALASIFQHSPAVLMTLSNSGLRTPHDLAYKRVGILVGGKPIVEMAAIFVNEGVKLDALALQSNAVGMDALAKGELDADYGYMTTDPFRNQQAGREIHYIQPINYGVDFYGDTLFTTERHIQEYPEQVAALRRAVVRGWQYALDNPDEIINIMLERYPDLERDALNFEAEKIRELVRPDIVQIGHMNRERWRRMADTFVKLGMVNDTTYLDGFLYDNGQKPDYAWVWWTLGVLGIAVAVGFFVSGVVGWLNGRLQEKNALLQQAIQAQQETDQRLQESQRSLQSLVGNLPGMAYRCRHDRDWSMEFVSEGCESLTGYPPVMLTDTHGLDYANLIHPDDMERVWQIVDTAVTARQPFQLTYRIRHRLGEWRWVWEQGHGVQWDAAGVPQLLEGLIMDITSQVDTQQKLQQAKEQADAATRAKSIFLANISHEIRTPLNAVTGLAQLLQQAGLDGRQRDYVEQLYSSSRLLMGIVEDVMDFSCIEAGEVVLRPAAFNLQGILQSVGHMIQGQVQAKGLLFHLELDSSIPPVLVGDPLRLSQVLNNLLGNAVKFTRQGSVLLHVSQQAATDGQIRLQFSVRDTGIGISASQRERLFEPFVRLESGHPGTQGAGLGLSISRRLIELMGGSIRVESIPGVGSEFSFCADFGVEARHTTLTNRPVVRPESMASGLAGKRILLVDDEALNRMLAQELLHIFGCQVQSASSAAEAQAILEQATFDAVLMDIEMPGMKGDELTRQLRKDVRWQTLPIIALTAHATTTVRDQCLASGMSDYLAKPFEVAQLQAILLQWVDKPLSQHPVLAFPQVAAAQDSQ